MLLDKIKYGVCEDEHLETLKALTNDEVSLFESYLPMITPPPENSSLQTKDEISELLWLQKNKRNNLREIITDIDFDIHFPYAKICKELGISQEKSKAERVLNFGKKLALFYKAYFNRARPFQISLFYSDEFAPMASISAWTAAYPSGHSLQAEMLCSMYCNIYPQYSNLFLTATELVSYSRMVGGFHYRSDIESSKQISNLFGEYIL